MKWLPGLALNLILPPICPVCRTLVGTPGDLCPECWEQITFISEPMCKQCGLPFETDENSNTLCGHCMKTKPHFDQARAVMIYNDFSRRILIPFKNSDRTEMAPTLAHWLRRSGLPLMNETDIIAPVPLHWTRLFKRRYNQSALLASELTKGSKTKLVLDLLKRTKRTPPQVGLSAAARRKNVQGAFIVNPKQKTFLSGKRVLLIDDVVTTGATVNACAKVLKRGGAKSVNVLTLAKTAN
ncbi:MAG: ComF family protein [Rhodospirillales bacterium]|nr:ComF family protein [Rhodospirillales bacterium]